MTVFAFNAEIIAVVFFEVLQRDYFGKNYLRALREKLMKYILIKKILYLYH